MQLISRQSITVIGLCVRGYCARSAFESRSFQERRLPVVTAFNWFWPNPCMRYMQWFSFVGCWWMAPQQFNIVSRISNCGVARRL